MQPKHEILTTLNTVDLVCEAPSLVAMQWGIAKSVDEVAAFMYRGGPRAPQASTAPKFPQGDERPPKEVWLMTKHEFYVLLCTDSETYKDFWEKLSSITPLSTSGLAAVIAAFIGDKIGFVASVITGFVAVLLYGISKVGLEVFCKLNK